MSCLVLVMASSFWMMSVVLATKLGCLVVEHESWESIIALLVKQLESSVPVCVCVSLSPYILNNLYE